MNTEHPKTQQQVESLMEHIRIPHLALIGGKFSEATEGKSFASLSAIDGKKLTDLPQCSAPDVERSVAYARQVYDSGVWSRMAVNQRQKILKQFANLVDSHALELALLETLDTGKPISDSLSDVASSSRCLRWSAEAVDKIYGEIAPTPVSELGLIQREPLGVIGAIVPWNFPMLMACWKLAPALATGNSVILKPSERSTLSALRLAELALEAGLPEGVFEVITGFGVQAGEPLARHKDVDGLVFTGSTAVGQHLSSLGALSNLKRVFVECGGKSPNIIFADAPDLDEAARIAAQAIFYHQGQVCTAGSRLLVDHNIFEDFIAQVVKYAKEYQPSHPLDPTAKAGALIDQAHAQRVLGYIETALAEGATLLTGGQTIPVVEGGHYLDPTVLTDLKDQATLVKEEVFGPVLGCQGFASEEEAIAKANDTCYGLAASLWTKDVSRAHRVAQRIRAGSVWVNHYDGGDMTAPFGGYKQSGNGRDKSIHAFDKYTELKATWIKLD